MIARPTIVAAMAAAGFVTFAAMGPAAAAKPSCPGGALKVGAVSTITGPADFSDAPKAAKAVFDQLNAVGGINGCKVDYTIEDDKGDPQVAAQGARDLVDNQSVVALAGGASFVDCQVNAGTYQREGVRAIQGVGIDAACFNVPSIAPVNVGPFTLTTAVALYGSEVLKLKKLCADFIIIGGTQEAYSKAIARWEQISGQKIHQIDLTLPLQGDLTAYLVKVRDAGCDGVITNSIEPGAVQWIKTADAQKISGVKWLFLASAYTAQVAKAVQGTQQEAYVGTEWEPFTDMNAAANKDWRAAMRTAGLPLTAFSQGGFLAATMLIDVIKTIDGPVTHDTVTKALASMKPISNPLSGSPWVFGPGKAHAPMQATKIMKLDGAEGAWKVVTPDWRILSDKN